MSRNVTKFCKNLPLVTKVAGRNSLFYKDLAIFYKILQGKK
jgi:hypothetical protein